MIYAVVSHFNRCDTFTCCRAIVVEKGKEERRKERSQKIDDLPVLVTCWSDTLAILSIEVNGLVGHGSTR